MSVPVGLCAGCQHARRVETARSVFVMCGLSATNPRYPKYPRLPVLACAGYAEQAHRGAAEDAEKADGEERP